MDQLKVIFTKNYFSPFSWIVRWTLPRSRFALALSSHCFIYDGNGNYYEAVAFKGVVKISSLEMSKNDIIVATKNYQVRDINAAYDFLEKQLGKKYDYKGVIGLALNPARNWASDEDWFCYELCAAALKISGGPQFNNLNHITETALLSVSEGS